MEFVMKRPKAPMPAVATTWVRSAGNGRPGVLYDQVRRQFMTLPEPERLVLILTVAADLRIHEVAREMDMTPYGAARHYDSGWARLRAGLSLVGIKDPENIQRGDLQMALCESIPVPEGLFERIWNRLKDLHDIDVPSEL